MDRPVKETSNGGLGSEKLLHKICVYIKFCKRTSSPFPCKSLCVLYKMANKIHNMLLVVSYFLERFHFIFAAASFGIKVACVAIAELFAPL